MRLGGLNTISDLNVKLGSHIACSALNRNPVIVGILVAALEQSATKSCGASMTRLRLSALELSMIAEGLRSAWQPVILAKQFGPHCIPQLPRLGNHGLVASLFVPQHIRQECQADCWLAARACYACWRCHWSTWSTHVFAQILVWQYSAVHAWCICLIKKTYYLRIGSITVRTYT